MNNEELELWIEYKERYNLEARDALIEKYLQYSYSIGVNIYKRYRDFLKLDKDEIFGITSFALIKAIENFDHTKNVPFTKFLSKVMSWYIKQEFSKYMNVSIRDQMKLFKKIASSKRNDYLEFVIGLSYRNMGSINDCTNFIKDDTKLEENMDKKEILILIAQALEYMLDDKEKQVLKFLYFDNKKLNFISDEMKLTKQRVNQIHKAALQKIKNFIKKSLF